MSNAIEIEAKVLISQDDYRKLAKVFPYSPRYIQTNYYIDSDTRILNKEGIALRIRERNGQYELTLKTPLSQGLLEKNCTISHEQFLDFTNKGIFPKGDTSRFLTMLDIDIATLKIITSLTTERIDVDYEGGLLSIDRNVYSGITDYEIEFEYNNLEGAKEILSNLLKKNGIMDFTFSKNSKTHRAMEALKKE